jgi:hypothetical protein
MEMTEMKVFGVLVAITLVIAFLIWWPFAVIWAVNTLFGTAIAFTWTNWLATLVLTGIFQRSSVANSIKK